MRHSDVSTGQLRAEPSNPHRFARPFCFDQFIPAPGHNVKRVIFNLSELAGYWAHMMRKGTGAAFVIMPDEREGKMVLEYVRWWTFSYLSQGINKLLTFKEQQLSDQERVGSRSPPPPEPTYIWTHFRAGAATQIIATSERKGRFSTRHPDRPLPLKAILTFMDPRFKQRSTRKSQRYHTNGLSNRTYSKLLTSKRKKENKEYTRATTTRVSRPGGGKGSLFLEAKRPSRAIVKLSSSSCRARLYSRYSRGKLAPYSC
ncbi:unnamed protein product [Lupinus luteus]|uniref:Uncharacterized protein n=1 Tax=Lupinus luteus TaxID=3873 RepID=A0AAV1Y7U0_LUPLU